MTNTAEGFSGQREVDSLSEKGWDVIIVGGGPAGAICAVTLARYGHRVLVLDRDRFPRHKPCGDLLIADSIEVLGRVGLLEHVARVARSLKGLRVFSPSRIDFGSRGQFMTIRRYDFDSMLMQTAVEAGATFAHARVVDLRPSDSGPLTVELAGSTRPLQARIGVLATGAGVEIPYRLGMIARKQPSAVAIRCYLRSSFNLEEAVLSYDRSLIPGYAWIFPMNDGLYNVGCGNTLDHTNGPAPLKKMLRRFMDTFPLTQELLAAGGQESDIGGAALRCKLTGWRSVVKENLVCIGEVIGTTLAFTGEGIGKAMHSGEIAGQVISEALKNSHPTDLTQFHSRLAVEIQPAYAGYLAAEKWLSRPWLNDFMARRIRRSRYLQRQLESLVSQTGDPRSLFSVKGVLRSFWR
jgi:geranylgeranyl reductase family protein